MGRTRGSPQSLGHIGHPHYRAHGQPILWCTIEYKICTTNGAPTFITWATHRSQWEGHGKDVHNKQLRLLHNLRVLMGGGFSALRVIHVLLVMQRF